jgi:hypothetical protein
MCEARPNPLLAILLDCVFRCPVVVLKTGLGKGAFRRLCSSAKSLKNIKSTMNVCGPKGGGIVVPRRSRPHLIPQETSDVQGFRSLGSSAGKALHMRHHAWASKQLIVLAALALAFAPVARTAKFPSSFHLDGKTGGTERVSAPPVPLDHNSNAQEAARQTAPPSPTVAGQPAVKPPQVTYEDGELTIIAENSSLSEVMKALRSSLGADIDLPSNVTDQHIWVRLGPGPARRVLRDLLDGTEFNYVIQASESDPDGVRSVLLTPKSTGAENAPAAKTGIRWMPGHGPDAQQIPTDSQNPAPEPVASADPSQASPPASPADGSSNSARVQNTPASFEPISPRPAPATDPNGQIQQLQTLYEQRRQLQMQQNQRPAAQNQ